MNTVRCSGISSNFALLNGYNTAALDAIFFRTNTAFHSKKCDFVVQSSTQKSSTIRCPKCNSSLRNLARTLRKLPKAVETTTGTLSEHIQIELELLLEENASILEIEQKLRELSYNLILLERDVQINIQKGPHKGKTLRTCPFIKNGEITDARELTWIPDYPCTKGHIIFNNGVKHSECSMCIIGYNKKNNLSHCESCNKLKTQLRAAIYRESQNKNFNNDHTHNSKLSTTELHRKLEYMRKQLEASRTKVLRKVKQLKEMFSTEEAVEVDTEIGHLIENINKLDNFELLIRQILKQKVSKNLSVECENCISEDEYITFSKAFCEAINNKAKSIAGRPTQHKYSPTTIRYALMLYNTSKKGYETAKKSPFLTLPSKATMEKHAKLSRVESGKFIHVYSRVTRMLKDEQNDVLVYVDEMKLEGGLLWNTSNRQIVGYSDEPLEWDIWEHEKREKNENIANFVSQFKIRICGTNECFPGEYFYSEKCASSSELQAQVKHVFLCLILSNFNPKALILDSGTSNMLCVKSLMKNAYFKSLKEPVLQSEQCSFNFEFLIDSVFVIPCSVHLLKNLRNSFYASSLNKKRFLCRKNHSQISWKHVELCYKRDLERANLNLSTNTNLTINCLELTPWTKMRVSLAKTIFDRRVIVEMMEYLCLQLKIAVPVVVGTDVEGQLLVLNEQKHMGGLLSAKLLYIIGQKTLTNEQDSLSETILFMCFVHELFHEVLLNKYLKVTKSNIHELRCFVNFRLGYFAQWRHFLGLNDESTSTASWNFVPNQTWRSLRACCNGFLHYSENLLRKNVHITYVPMLHFNTSTLESFFGYVRGACRYSGADVQTYKKAVSSVSFKNLNLMIQKGSYDPQDCQEAEDVCTDLLFMKDFLKYEINVRRNIDTLQQSNCVLCINSNMKLFHTWSNNESLLKVLNKADSLISFSWATKGSRNGDFFNQFFVSSTNEHECILEKYIHGVIESILSFYVLFLNRKNALPKPGFQCFETCLNESVCSGSIQKAFLQQTIVPLPSNAAKHALLECLLPILRNFILSIQLESEDNNLSYNSSQFDYDFHVFVGFAISSAMKSVSKKMKKKNKKCTNYAAYYDFLQNLVATETATTVIQHRSRGGLISPHSCLKPWAMSVFIEIYRSTPPSFFCPSTIWTIWKELTKNNTLFLCFTNSVNEFGTFTESASRQIHNLLLKKLFHSRVNEIFKSMKMRMAKDENQKNPKSALRENLKHLQNKK